MGNAGAQRPQALFDEVLHHGAVGAHRADQSHLTGDHTHGAGVAALHGTDADHRLVKRRQVARHHALDSGDDVPGHQHRVHTLVRAGAVPALADDADLDAVDRRLHRAGGDANHTQRRFGRIVLGINLLAREPVEQAILHHGAGTRVAFFAGLKNQHGRPVKTPGFGQVAGRAHQHGGVAVVTAAVHQPGCARLPSAFIELGQGQCIHVGAQADHAAGVGRRAALAVHQGHHTGFADAGVDAVHAAHLQHLGHAACGVNLFKTQLGVSMQVAPESRELGVKLRDACKRCAPPQHRLQRSAHVQWPPGLPTRRRGSTTK